jgi:hypothetical protein
LNVQTNELQVNSNKVALSSEVPVLEVLSQEEFETKKTNNELDDDTFYCTFSDKQKDGVVTAAMLEQYWTRGQVKEYMQTEYRTEQGEIDINQTNPLLLRVIALE